jgi:hypothetical protein
VTQRNIELLQHTMQHIKDHPEKHDQNNYWTSCGTPLCFAGWATHFNGTTMKQIRSNPHSRGTAHYAASILGLAPHEAIMLFAAGNTIPMLELMVKDLVNGDELRVWHDYRREAGE